MTDIIIEEKEKTKKEHKRNICKDFDHDCLDFTYEQCVKCWLHEIEDYCIMIME